MRNAQPLKDINFIISKEITLTFRYILKYILYYHNYYTFRSNLLINLLSTLLIIINHTRILFCIGSKRYIKFLLFNIY